MTPTPRRAPALLRTATTVLLAALLLAGCRDGAASHASPTRGPAAPSASGSAAAPTTGPAATAGTAAPSRFPRYVALGDSYTAAPGTPGPTIDPTCLRSASNYPHLLRTALGVGELADVSCSGARTTDVWHPQHPRTPPQLAAVTTDTDLVTIGLGGNDFDLFSNLLRTCLRQDAAAAVGAPCTGRLEATVPDELRGIERSLRAVVRAVRHRAPRARIVLVGYPQLLPATGTCPQAPFAAGDYAFARSVNEGFSDAVARAARAERVGYLDVWKASAGHDICSSDPWVNGLTGAGAAPFHPFAVEQRAVAGLLEQALA